MKALRAILYARVSTDRGEQDPESQLGALRTWAAARGWRIVGEAQDRVTGDAVRRRRDPPGLTRAIQHIEEREAEVLVIFSAERLVRSPWELIKVVARVQSLGGQVASYQDGGDLDTTSDEGEFTLIMKGWFARMFLKMNRKATKAGIERARAAGKRLGRPPVDIDPAQVVELRRQGKSWSQVGVALGCKASTARMVLQRHLAKNPPANSTPAPVDIPEP